MSEFAQDLLWLVGWLVVVVVFQGRRRSSDPRCCGELLLLFLDSAPVASP